MHLDDEIREQPEVLNRLISEQIEATKQVVSAIQAFDPTFICIAARGTSDNAARYGQYLFGSFNQLATVLAAPSLHTIYEAPPNLSRALVIGISQSGQAEDVRQVLEDANEQGGLTLSLTNYPDSPMAQTAQHHLALLAGEERSIAATKTYTAELAVIAMLACMLKGGSEVDEALKRLPEFASATLKLSEGVIQSAERYRYMEKFAVIGRGYNYSTAFEISLKVKELAYIEGTGYSEADFRHGPIAVVQPGFPVLLVAPKGKMLPKMLDLADKLAERSAECLVISNDEAMLEKGHQMMRLPRDVPEWLSPIVSVIPGQLFAMQQAVVRGYPVDRPRGLSKVTVTS